MKKTIIILTIVAALIASAFASMEISTILDAVKDKPKKEIFKVFHYLHKKEYKLDSEEGIKRYRIFKENLNWAKAKNAELGKEVYGITQFMDLTHEEFKTNHLMNNEIMQTQINSIKSKSNPKKFLNNNINQKTFDFDSYADEEEQDELLIMKSKFSESKLKQNSSSVDWSSWMNRPKNQGNCGSCWAFSAIATIEGNFNLNFGKLYDFSEQHLVDCDSLDGGCDGGWPSNTYRWIMDNGVVESKYSPYRESKRICNKSKLSRLQHKIVSNFTMYENNNDTSEWYKLLSRGPMLVAMDASDFGFQMYRPNKNEPWRPESCGDLNHAIVAVGYEERNGTVYLKVRNSWGTEWGDSGYFYVHAQNSCGITDFAWLPEVVNRTNPTPDPDIDDTGVIPDNCARIFDKCGFNGNHTVICDSVSNLLDFGIKSIRLSNNTRDIDQLVMFEKPNCSGKRLNVWKEESCASDYFGNKNKVKSISFNRRNDRGCIALYNNTCLGGDALTLCNSTNYIDPEFMDEINSIDMHEDVDFVAFFEEPNFVGKAYSIVGKDIIYNVNQNKNLIPALKKTKSIYLGFKK